jgi:hypothetical protein
MRRIGFLLRDEDKKKGTMADQAGNKDFGEWLIGQQKRKDEVGELARYAKRHKGFRRDMNYREFRELLPEPPVTSVNDEPMDAYWQAVLEYMKYKEDRKQRWRNMFHIPRRGRKRRRRRS